MRSVIRSSSTILADRFTSKLKHLPTQMPLSQVCGFLVKLKLFILLQTLVLMEMSMSSPE